MEKEYYRLKIYKDNFIRLGSEVGRYKIYYEAVYHDDIGRRYSKIKKVMTYSSLQDAFEDIDGYLAFIEYEDEIPMDMEVADETSL